MRLVLICSSLEPGKDGVGDYSRRLAAMLIYKGHQVALLALNDGYVNQVSSGYQDADGQQIQVLRIPRQTLKQNGDIVKKHIAEYNPDWLSLQYVIFGYHVKGLPFGLHRQLAAIGGNTPWHIMFHELWLGMAIQETVKLKLWGSLQRRLIKQLLKSLKPKALHTQTRLYQQQLEKLGYHAGYLPIFSNIPVAEAATAANASLINLVVFGLIHTGAAIEPLAADAALYAQRHGVQVKLTFAGNCGSQQGLWAAAWQQAGLPVEVLGAQPAGRISAVLQSATLGLNSTAMAVIEKSGAFAAMRQHRLPVLNISKPWTPRGLAQPLTPPAGVVAYTAGSFESIIINRNKYISLTDGVDTIAQKMLNDLSANA